MWMTWDQDGKRMGGNRVSRATRTQEQANAGWSKEPCACPVLDTIPSLPVPRHWLGQRDVEKIVYLAHIKSLEEWVPRDLGSLTEG